MTKQKTDCCKKCRHDFRKNFDASKYVWCPDNQVIKSTRHQMGGGSIPPSVRTGCNATAFSHNGEDYNVRYVYSTQTINGIEFRYAYVECGYVA